LNRRALRLSAVVGAIAVSALAVAPVFAAAPVSQATARSLNLTIAGTPAISQLATATNDGTTETNNNLSTLPTIASVIPGNTLLGAGVLPNEARALKTGVSYACAGVAGTGGGIVTIGTSGCNINGQPLTINLADLALGNALLGQNSALGAALNSAPGIGAILTALGTNLNSLTMQISNALASTPLGQVKVGGSLSAIEAFCTANPTVASGTAHLVDTSGGSAATSIGITVPTGSGTATTTIHLLDLPANPPPNTNLLIDLSTVTGTLTTALQTDLANSLQAALIGINPALGTLQSSLLVPLSAGLTPLTTAISQNLLNVVLNKQVFADGGRSIAVTALDAQVVPAAAAALPGGSSLISGELGKVTCGPNRAPAGPPTPTPTPTPPTGNPKPPTVVDSGFHGANDTTRNVLTATAALMLLAGTAGLIGYRRMLTK
jgi:hypothetical protein